MGRKQERKVKGNQGVSKSGTRSFGGHGKRRPLPESVVIDRKGRKVGSDDLQSAALVAKWAEEAGLRGPQVQAATGIAIALEAAVELSFQGHHRDAGKKAASCAYVLKRNDKVGGLKVQCRDGRTRKLAQVVEWYASVHFRIADEIEAKQAEEAELRETRKRNAELKRKAAEVIAEGEKVAAASENEQAAADMGEKASKAA